MFAKTGSGQTQEQVDPNGRVLQVMVVDLDANSIQDWSGGPVTSVSGPTLELLPLLQRMTVLPLLKFGTVDPVALHRCDNGPF